MPIQKDAEGKPLEVGDIVVQITETSDEEFNYPGEHEIASVYDLGIEFTDHKGTRWPSGKRFKFVRKSDGKKPAEEKKKRGRPKGTGKKGPYFDAEITKSKEGIVIIMRGGTSISEVLCGEVGVNNTTDRKSDNAGDKVFVNVTSTNQMSLERYNSDGANALVYLNRPNENLFMGEHTYNFSNILRNSRIHAGEVVKFTFKEPATPKMLDGLLQAMKVFSNRFYETYMQPYHGRVTITVDVDDDVDKKRNRRKRSAK